MTGPRRRGTDPSAVLATDAGSWALWQPETFAHVDGYESWARELEDDLDLLRHVRRGALVPVYLWGDGSFRFDVRVGRPERWWRRSGAAVLTEHERAHLVVSSEPYLFVSHGTASLGGLETVGSTSRPLSGRLDLEVPAGRWSVTAHLLEDEEEEAPDADGRATETSLPDVLLLLEPEHGMPTTYRRSLETFDRPA